MREKISNVCKTIFGYGIMLVLFGGGITFFGYVIALIVGGDFAANLCAFIYDKYLPIVIYASTILILFGLVSMYIAGEKSLTIEKKGSHHEGER